MIRLVELADSLKRSGDLSAIDFRDVTREDMLQASEILIVGTTRDVTSVHEYDGRPVGDGCPGPLAPRLNALLLADMRSNAAMRTDMFERNAP
jgi:branched-chain amino acid aminotransferase